MKRLPVILLLGVVLVVAGLVSCEKEVEKIVEAPPAIQVTEINLSSTDITPGQTVNLTAAIEAEDTVNTGNLRYEWFADKGTFKVSEGDTGVWKAPADSGMVKVSVHVTDGEDIAIGNRDVGVGMYTPSADRYYVGVETCQQCHSGTHENWAETGHAEAWAGLQTSDHVASYCEPCHSVNQNNTEGNSGYDEVPTAKFQDVQCESCHGPGSDHAASPSADNIDSKYAALAEEACAVCHEGGHHPYHEQWQESAHNFDPAEAAHGAGARSYCQPCHSGTGFVEAYDDEYTDLYANAEDKMGITCGVCHDSHSGEHPGQVRTVAAVTLVSNGYDSDGETGETIDLGGSGQLCLQCHQARRAPEGPNATQISQGYEHFGPHSSVQGDVVYGETGYEAVNKEIVFASSGHGLIEDACASCHVYQTEYDPVTNFANVGHTFEPRVEACVQCHGEISDFADIRAKADYDNDGAIEGIQNEVSGLLDLLVTELVEYDEAHGGQYMGGNPDADPGVITDSLTATHGDTSQTAVNLRKAGFNLVYALNDGSLGVHNPAYVIQLLQQSILYLDEDVLPGNVILKEDRATTFTSVASR